MAIDLVQAMQPFVSKSKVAESSDLQRLDDLKTMEKTIAADRGEPAKDLLIVKSVFSLEHNCSKWVNSRTYLGPFYREFGVGLLVRCH